MANSLRTTKVVFQFPNEGTWLENIAVSSDGTLLTTRLDVPEVWAVNPSTGAASSIVKVPAPARSLTGICELSPGKFAIGAGVYDLAKGSEEDSWGIWTFSLADGEDKAQDSLHQVCQIKGAGLINGMTTWDENSVLAADSVHGTVYKIDISAGSYEITVSDELATPGPDAFAPLGINGIKLRDGHLYFTNTVRQAFYRVPVDKDAKSAGSVEKIAGGFGCDDFVFDSDGTAYIVTHIQNTLITVSPGSEDAVTIAGKKDTLEIAGGTACMFGRKGDDARKLYIVTCGGISMPVNGKIEPAKVISVDL